MYERWSDGTPNYQSIAPNVGEISLRTLFSSDGILMKGPQVASREDDEGPGKSSNTSV